MGPGGRRASRKQNVALLNQARAELLVHIADHGLIKRFGLLFTLSSIGLIAGFIDPLFCDHGMKLHTGKGGLLQGGASRQPKGHTGAQVKAPFEFGMG